jgi:hypothetical protein
VVKVSTSKNVKNPLGREELYFYKGNRTNLFIIKCLALVGSALKVWAR